jgi:hypothetical protein
MALGVASAAHGNAVAISYALQNRSVSAAAVAIGAPRGGTDSVPITSHQSDSQLAGGLGAFNGNASAIATALGVSGANASASATQDSALASTGFFDTGSVESDSVLGTGLSAVATSSSVFQVTFTVSQTQDYTFSANLSGGGSALGKIIFASDSGANVIAPITAVNLSNFKSHGILTPGTYSVIVDATTTSISEGGGILNFSAALADGAVAAPAVATVPSAVPLPAAWLDSSVMLGTLAIFGAARRRIAAVR